jgi:tryptophan synthase alpha chain
MNRIEKKFKELHQMNEKALIGFITAGDPNPAVSLNLVMAMCDAGLDLLELGIPFSDPTADGPVIQRASARALSEGMTLKGVLSMTAKIRRYCDIPIILFGYYNPIHAYGLDRFYQDVVTAGADGVLVVDLPPEESRGMLSHPKAENLPLIRLVAPTTPPERIAWITENASGFIYLVSKTGVTGSDGLDPESIRKNTRRVKDLTPLPVCIGFGISTAADIKVVAREADGIVIGSAFERLIEENLESRDVIPLIKARVAEYKAATRF